jgi:hypothetical protein
VLASYGTSTIPAEESWAYVRAYIYLYACPPSFFSYFLFFLITTFTNIPTINSSH